MGISQSCANAGRMSTSQDELTYVDKKIFVCNKCPAKYANTGTLYRHKFSHSDESRFSCIVCAKSFKNSTILFTHKRSHQMKTLTCQNCPVKFNSRSALKMHQITHTGKKDHVCQICMKAFTQVGSLYRHQQFHEEPNQQCDICEEKFHDRNGLLLHKKSKHINPKEVVSEEDKIRRRTCEICKKIFKARKRLTQHLKNENVHKIQCFYCEDCKKRFTSLVNLSKHQKEYHNSCSSCEKTYGWKEFLDSTQTNSFDCSLCPVTFKTVSGLSKHYRLNHIGMKKYTCNHCGDKFKFRKYFMKHIEKKDCAEDNCVHECAECNQTFYTGHLTQKI